MSVVNLKSMARVLTPTGRGAVATLRVSGSIESGAAAFDRFFRPANRRPFAEQGIGRICFGTWRENDSPDGSAEEVVVCRISEDLTELSCHGGQAAVERILRMFADVGFAVADSDGGSLGTASLAGECSHALTLATTRRTVEQILRQLPDRLQRAVLQIVDVLDEATGTPDQSGGVIDVCRGQLAELLGWSQFGLHLTRPWRVVLVGRPNVGKSTLINALLGYDRSIVFDQPGTTRDVVVGETAFEGWPVQLADTAGIRRTESRLESAGIAKSQHEIANADCVCWLFDLSANLSNEEFELLASIRGVVDRRRLIIVLHKADLVRRWEVAEFPEDLLDRCVAVSSATRTGIDELISRIVAVLVPKIPEADATVPLTQRQVDCLRSACDSLSDEPSRLRDSIGALRELLVFGD